MKFRLVLALVIAALPAAAPAELAPQLSPFAFLAESCWRATFPGGTQTDTHCFTSVFGGRFLRDRHIVEGGPAAYRGETLYRWDAAGRAIRYDYYSSDGDHSAGTAAPAGDAIAFIEDVDGASPARIRSSWTRQADGYLAVAEAAEGTGWRTLWRMRFTRVGPAPAN